MLVFVSSMCYTPRVQIWWPEKSCNVSWFLFEGGNTCAFLYFCMPLVHRNQQWWFGPVANGG